VVQGRAGGDVLPGFADHDGELAFVVELGLGGGVDGDGVEGAGEGVAGFGKDDGVGGDLQLGGIVSWVFRKNGGSLTFASSA
jgi:hypothetical protein